MQARVNPYPCRRSAHAAHEFMGRQLIPLRLSNTDSERDGDIEMEHEPWRTSGTRFSSELISRLRAYPTPKVGSCMYANEKRLKYWVILRTWRIETGGHE